MTTIATYPPIGEMVTLSLADGNTVEGYWDGLQWWTGLENDPVDAPILNDFVVSWAA